MDPYWIYEIIGYVASILVAISLMMSSILKLRIINLAGSAFFTAYGVLIGSYPVAAVNLFIVGVNLFYLARMFGSKEYFRGRGIERIVSEPGTEEHQKYLRRMGFAPLEPREPAGLYVRRVE